MIVKKKDLALTEVLCCFSALENLSATIWVSLADLAVRELTHTNAIWVKNIFLTISKLDCLYTRFLNLLNSTVREDAFLLTILKDALNSSIREAKKITKFL